MEAIFGGFLMILAGLFSLLASIFEWGFFFRSRKASGFVAIFGYRNTRIMYMVIGVLVGLMGVGFVGFGVVQTLKEAFPEQFADTDEDETEGGRSSNGRSQQSAADPTIDSLPTSKPTLRFEGHDSSVYSAVVSPDGRLVLSGGHQGELRLWELETGVEQKVFPRVAGSVSQISASPNGKFAVVGSERENRDTRQFEVRIWDWDSADRLESIPTSHGGSRVAISSDGRYLFVAVRAEASLIDRDSGGAVQLNLGSRGVGGGQFTPDGQRLVIGTNGGELHIVDVDSGSKQTISGGDPKGECTSVAVSPDGRFAATAHRNNGDESARVWDLRSGRMTHRLTGHQFGLGGVGFSQNSRLITAGIDQILILWDPAAGKPVHRFQGGASWMNSVSVTADNRFLVSASTDGIVYVWKLPN